MGLQLVSPSIRDDTNTVHVRIDQPELVIIATGAGAHITLPAGYRLVPGIILERQQIGKLPGDTHEQLRGVKLSAVFWLPPFSHRRPETARILKHLDQEVIAAAARHSRPVVKRQLSRFDSRRHLCPKLKNAGSYSWGRIEGSKDGRVKQDGSHIDCMVPQQHLATPDFGVALRWVSVVVRVPSSRFLRQAVRPAVQLICVLRKETLHGSLCCYCLLALFDRRSADQRLPPTSECGPQSIYDKWLMSLVQRMP